MKSGELCIARNQKLPEIQFDLKNQYIASYHRVFIHVYGTQDLIQKCKSVFLSSFIVSTSDAQLSIKLNSNASRAGEDMYLLKTLAKSDKLEVSA